MGQLNEVDEAAIGMAEQFWKVWADTRNAPPVPAGTERLSARDYRNRLAQMTPKQQADEYRRDPEAFLRAVQEVAP